MMKWGIVGEACTYGHPNGEANPGAPAELHHQVHVDEHADNWDKGQQRYLFGGGGRKGSERVPLQKQCYILPR